MGTGTYAGCVGGGDRGRDNYSNRINLHNGRILSRDSTGGRRMRKNKPIMFTQAQLHVIFRAVQAHGEKWGEPITTDYTDPILDLLTTELKARDEEKTRINNAFATIASDYGDTVSEDGYFEMEGE
jgi:hypothetical protein